MGWGGGGALGVNVTPHKVFLSFFLEVKKIDRGGMESDIDQSCSKLIQKLRPSDGGGS